MQYDSPVTGEQLAQSLSANPRLTPDVLAAINAILGLDVPGREFDVGAYDGINPVEGPNGDGDVDVVIANIEGEPDDQITLELPAEAMDSASVWMFDTDADITTSFNTIERVIVMGNGDDNVTVDGDQNTTLDGADGNDTLVTSGGDDVVGGGNGDDSVSTGDGNDTIVHTSGSDTIDGGDGFDAVVASGTADDWEITVVDGQLVLTSTGDPGSVITASSVEFIQLEEGSISVTGNDTDADTLRLYEGLLGRSADVEGAEYWLEDVNSEGRTVQDIANAFMATEEYAATMGETTDLEFVMALYENALGRQASESEATYWVEGLQAGQDRGAVAVGIVGSPEAAEHIASVLIVEGQV